MVLEKPTLGAIIDHGATTFRVWAPECIQVDVVLANAIYPLARDASGYWSATLTGVSAGDTYRFRLDSDEARVFPDPASRFQPSGVHGPSQVVDPAAYRWRDAGFEAPAFHELVFYELHIGTFSPEGTFRGAIDRLDHVRALGATAIEVMPVGDFPGDRNWGYDGVAIFAPSRAYGTPDDLRALIDAAHQLGLSVFLDVVYNHLGPDGAYANAFSPYYFTDRHCSPWGKGVNLDGPWSRDVRRFFIENALHWIREYHVDGLRLDATHEMRDDSPQHFLAELSATIHACAGRRVYLVAEDHRNLAALATPVDRGGLGMDAVWADDLHHELRVHVTGDREGYYSDYSGRVEDIATTLTQGWFFTGQRSRHLDAVRGTDPSGLQPEQFVVCIQNHDQIGNRADGARLHHHIDLATYRALVTLLLLAPETPLLFMGQEWAATAPFLFFTDHYDALGRQVTEGRRAEFQSFRAFADPATRAQIPDPQARDTFERSRLAWTEVNHAPHGGILRLHQRVLSLRSQRPRLTRRDVGVETPDASTVVLDVRDMRVIARLSGDGDVLLEPSVDVSVMLTTEDAAFATDPQPLTLDLSRGVIRFARPGAVVMSMPLAPSSTVQTNRP